MRIFWLDGGLLVGFNKEVHSLQVVKFLYWITKSKEEVIVAGPVFSHIELIETPWHDINVELEIEHEVMLGAGEAKKGVIQFWDSTGFSVVTPKDIRPKIAEALGLQIND